MTAVCASLSRKETRLHDGLFEVKLGLDGGEDFMEMYHWVDENFVGEFYHRYGNDKVGVMLQLLNKPFIWELLPGSKAIGFCKISFYCSDQTDAAKLWLVWGHTTRASLI